MMLLEKALVLVAFWAVLHREKVVVVVVRCAIFLSSSSESSLESDDIMCIYISVDIIIIGEKK
jgi:hypothetical protein